MHSSNDLLAPERKGRAGKSGGIISSLVAARPFRPVKQGVKRTQKAAPPHHAVAPDFADSRSQVNRVLAFPNLKVPCKFHHRKY